MSKYPLNCYCCFPSKLILNKQIWNYHKNRMSRRKNSYCDEDALSDLTDNMLGEHAGRVRRQPIQEIFQEPVQEPVQVKKPRNGPITKNRMTIDGFVKIIQNGEKSNTPKAQVHQHISQLVRQLGFSDKYSLLTEIDKQAQNAGTDAKALERENFILTVNQLNNDKTQILQDILSGQGVAFYEAKNTVQAQKDYLQRELKLIQGLMDLIEFQESGQQNVEKALKEIKQIIKDTI